ncbi:MAG TPA: P1 family peptidase [Chryseosolibacter sp.]
MKKIIFSLVLLSGLQFAFAQSTVKKARARDLGIPFSGTPGAFNAITDVAGVEVGFTTLIEGHGKLTEGRGPVRTGVTAIFPKGKTYQGRVFAAWHTLNGNGEMTGTTWVKESGCLGSPVMITNTHSVGVVRDAVIEWYVKKYPSTIYSGDVSLPVVAETYDGFLNDINGFHVKKEHVFAALESAASGAVKEGNVGGGTGMICHYFKGGTGTSSRKIVVAETEYTVGVLVQTNYGSRDQLTIAGVPVGKEIQDLRPLFNKEDKDGSIIVVLATDAPLLPHQLERLAKRIPLGIGIVGGRGGNSSGDIFIAFSTANSQINSDTTIAEIKMLPNELTDRFFSATAEATEEAIINSLIAAETMEGINGNKIYAIPHDRLVAMLKKYNRIK